MSKKLLKYLSIAISAGLVIFIGIIIFNFSNSQAATNTIEINASDLTNAGFTGVKKIAPTASGRYKGPNIYFSINNKTAPLDSKIPKVVMIDNLLLPYNPGNGALFTYGNNSHAFNISGGAGEEATIVDGRTAINFVKGHHYMVIIGPDQTKIESLASALAAKIQ